MQAFSGIRIIDLTHVLAGPFATYQLAVLGADVIKIEHPRRPDQVRDTGTDSTLGSQRLGTNFLAQGSNKRAITLDLATKDGKDILRRLAATADVFVENYRAGALDALGFGYEDVVAIRPDIVYCSLTGFGQKGEKRDHTAYDGVIQAASGLMSVTGTPEITPLKVGAPVVDYAAGTTAAFAIASALMARLRTGRPQRVDVSMLDAALMLMSSNISGYHAGGTMLSVPRGNAFSTAEGSCYQTLDGLLMIAALNDRQIARLWALFDAPPFKSDDDRRQWLSRHFLQRGAAEWETLLNDAGIPAARVRSLPEALSLAQRAGRAILHRHLDPYGDGRDQTVPVAAFEFAENGPAVHSPPPRFGQHSEEILRELGYDQLHIDRFRSSGVT